MSEHAAVEEDVPRSEEHDEQEQGNTETVADAAPEEGAEEAPVPPADTTNPQPEEQPEDPPNVSEKEAAVEAAPEEVDEQPSEEEEEAGVAPPEDDATQANESAADELQENQEDGDGDCSLDDGQLHEVAGAPLQPKTYPRIQRPRKGAAKPVDPALAVIAGSWTTTALSHDFRKTEVRTNGIDAAVKHGKMSVPGGDDCICVSAMTHDTKGMQTLYARMLTTKQWW
jgi:outer membrane biosynthesis protein TonB